MATLNELKPDFVLRHYKDGTAQVLIKGGTNDVEIWFDMSAIPKLAAERYQLLVQAAYALGVSHTKQAIKDL